MSLTPATCGERAISTWWRLASIRSWPQRVQKPSSPIDPGPPPHCEHAEGSAAAAPLTAGAVSAAPQSSQKRASLR